METAIYMLALAIYTLVFVMVRTYEEADPKRYSRSLANEYLDVMRLMQNSQSKTVRISRLQIFTWAMWKVQMPYVKKL